MMKNNSRSGRFVFIAETLAMLFVFLLPLKFGSVIGIPDITMIYWRELFPLIISPWPSTLLPVFASLLLIVTLICVPKSPRCTPNGILALLWLAFAGAGTLGAFAEGVIVNYPMHMIPYGAAVFADDFRRNRFDQSAFRRNIEPADFDGGAVDGIRRFQNPGRFETAQTIGKFQKKRGLDRICRNCGSRCGDNGLDRTPGIVGQIIGEFKRNHFLDRGECDVERSVELHGIRQDRNGPRACVRDFDFIFVLFAVAGGGDGDGSGFQRGVQRMRRSEYGKIPVGPQAGDRFAVFAEKYHQPLERLPGIVDGETEADVPFIGNCHKRVPFGCVAGLTAVNRKEPRFPLQYTISKYGVPYSSLLVSSSNCKAPSFFVTGILFSREPFIFSA